MEDAVHVADKSMLEIEWDNLMLAKTDEIKTYNPKTAKQMFLNMFKEYSQLKPLAK